MQPKWTIWLMSYLTVVIILYFSFHAPILPLILGGLLGLVLVFYKSKK